MMKTGHRLLHLVMAVAFIVVLGGGSASAYVNSGGVDSIFGLDNYLGALSGAGISTQVYDGAPALADFSWDVTFIGAEAGHTNLLLDGAEIFNNQSTVVGATAWGVNLAAAEFRDTWWNPDVSYYIPVNPAHFLLYEVTSESMYNGITYYVGDLIIGFNDLYGDTDFDDMVLLARPTPIPGAVWLMGSGLLGLVGVRRRMMKRG